MRVLIIGCGYVGTQVGIELAGRGHEVFGMRRSSSSTEDLRRAGIVPLTGDITQPDRLARLSTDFQWVVNTAAASGGGPDRYRAIYYEGTRNVLSWLSPNPPRKYVYTSSTSVYGQLDGSWVDESSPTEASAETALILIETEQVIRSAAAFPGVILRVAGIYGPGRGYYLKQMLSGEARLEDDGHRFVNMIHRDDVAAAIVAALESAEPGSVYNVCDDEPAPVVEVYRWLADELRVPMPPSVPAQPEALRRRGLTNKRVSNRRLRNELRLALKYPTFREGYAAELRRLRQESPV